MIKEDCIYNKKRSCGALTKRICEKGECRFYKNRQIEKKAQNDVYERLRGLSKDLQQYIAFKYYDNKMPWEVRHETESADKA